MSYVELANEALSNIGTRSTISSLSEGSVEADTVSRYYNKVRQQMLRAAPWNFARAFAALSVLKALPGTPENTSPASSTWLPSYPPPPWLYTYAYPVDALMIRYVIPQTDDVTGSTPIYSANGYTTINTIDRWAKFAVVVDKDEDDNDTRVIATNAVRAITCYTRDVDNPDVWDSMFERGFVWALAGAIAIPLTGKQKLAGGMFEQANSVINEARAQDGNEGLTIADHVPDWIRTRGINYGAQWSDIPLTAWGPLFTTGGFS